MNYEAYASRFGGNPPAKSIIPKASFIVTFHDDDGTAVNSITTNDHASLSRLIANWMGKHMFGGVHIVNS